MSDYDWFRQRAEDAAFAEHEDGHPDGLPAVGCRYCRVIPDPELFSVDDEIPQFDIPEKLTREMP